MKNPAADMFSTLPDEILGRIVAFLPNEFALQTSLLSTRWRDLWNEALVRYGTAEDINGVVAGFLAQFEELDPLKHPRRLQFLFGEGSVLLATIASNTKLLLDFSTGSKELDGQFGLQLKLNKQITYQSFLPSVLVKSLYLKSLSSLTSEAVSSIISNMQHLENLVIIECSGLHSLCIEFESKLLKLTILDCSQLKSLHLRTSKLKYFRYRGLLPSIWPEFHFNLVEAMLDFRQGPGDNSFETENFDATLLTIKNSEILTLCEWTFKALIWPSISPVSGNFIFYKLKELWWVGNANEGCCTCSDALVSFLKLCPALEQLHVTIDPECYHALSSNSCLKKETKYTKLEHLKLIKFIGFTIQEDEIRLAKDIIQLVKGKTPQIEKSDGSCLQCLCRSSSHHPIEQCKSFLETDSLFRGN